LQINPSRRRVLKGAASAGLVLISAPALLRFATAQSWRAGDPFSLGVASGAPRPDGFVLWTPLAAEPLSTDPEAPGGVRGGDMIVGYEIATDIAMRDIIRRRSAGRADIRLLSASGRAGLIILGGGVGSLSPGSISALRVGFDCWLCYFRYWAARTKRNAF
jgi:PhoD-like phosphatase, N-terminal domain